MDPRHLKLEKFAAYGFFIITVYLSVYLTLNHYAGEGFILSLAITHLGIFIAFRRVLDRLSYFGLAFSHIVLCYWLGKNALEILSTIDGWKQGF
ncbi:hypothetical protein EHQ81_04900 [Leptospira selangorensis]|uniref:Uncharacterized protein n=1 Tax=Leptospira selangorensis TaxID=2484982 RepID=A0A5F2C340_9LEPT|nr:hypothetical protein [Leptospira selangorensis]TGM15737.1 hypothetical protein EHQ81_04900 [Leptospira selangorensis]TGM18313.1 hypothetical protein EHQ82_14805 [Leptospira selangorensis]